MRFTTIETRKPLLRCKVWLSFLRLQLWPVILLCLAFAGQSAAYSYSAKGKEVLLEGRKSLLVALDAGNIEQVQAAMASLEPELAYLEARHKAKVLPALKAAIAARDTAAAAKAMDAAFAVEIERRLDIALAEIQNYQTAKVLVVKSKLFLDLIQGRLSADQWQAADEAIRQCLAAIGNPGVFGVGKEEPNPADFAKARTTLIEQIRWMNPAE